MAKYVFRIDDVCENMNWKTFDKVMLIFEKYSVVPLLGIIPSNQDESLLKYPCFVGDFWANVKSLYDCNKIEVALHGFNHKYINNDSGIFKINNQSEFAGLPMQEQCRKVREGKSILIDNGINPIAFMAPSHSLDKNTVTCLRKNGIGAITDGYGRFPYKYLNVTFVPQMYARPRTKKRGVYTWCLHTNTMTKEDLENLEFFLKNNHKDVIKFSDALSLEKNNIYYRVEKFMIRIFLITYRKLRNYMSYKLYKK